MHSNCSFGSFRTKRALWLILWALIWGMLFAGIFMLLACYTRDSVREAAGDQIADIQVGSTFGKTTEGGAAAIITIGEGVADLADGFSNSVKHATIGHMIRMSVIGFCTGFLGALGIGYNAYFNKDSEHIYLNSNKKPQHSDYLDWKFAFGMLAMFVILMGGGGSIGYALAGSKPWIYAGIWAGFFGLGAAIILWIAYANRNTGMSGLKDPRYHTKDCYANGGECTCPFRNGRGAIPQSYNAAQPLNGLNIGPSKIKPQGDSTSEDRPYGANPIRRLAELIKQSSK